MTQFSLHLLTGMFVTLWQHVPPVGKVAILSDNFCLRGRSLRECVVVRVLSTQFHSRNGRARASPSSGVPTS